MLGEKMEEYVLDLLKAKDAEIQRLNGCIDTLCGKLENEKAMEEDLKSALKAVGRDVELVIQQDGEEYIKPRKDHWSTQQYTTRDLLTLKPYIGIVRDERKENAND